MSNKCLSCVAVAVISFFASAARAEDLRSPLWAGAYAGAHLVAVNGKLTNLYALDESLSGTQGGFHIGYNAQVSNVVFGLEASTDVGHVKGARWTMGFERYDYRNIGSGSLKGRLGYAFGPLLLYGTAGVAVDRMSFDDTLFFGGPPIKLHHERLKAGLVGGGGVAYRIGERNSFNVEALRQQYDEVVYEGYKYREMSVRAGLSWHFN